MYLRALVRATGHVCPFLLLGAFLLVPDGLLAQRVVDIAGTDRALQPRLEEVFRVGKIDGAHWELFGADPEVAFDGAGNLHVLDAASHRVVVIGPDGRFRGEIGRRGEGPGELRFPQGFVVMRDGTVVIGDLGRAAFVIFGPDGTYRNSVSFRGPDGFTQIGALDAVGEGGSLISAGRRAAMIQAGGGARPGGAAAERSITRFDLRGAGSPERIFTGWAPPAPEAPQARGIGGGPGGPGGMIRPLPAAFEPQLLATVLPDGGLVVSDSTAYALKVLRPDGRIDRVLRRPFRPAPVTARVERAERERRLADIEAGGTGGPGAQTMGQAGGGGGGGPSPAQMREIRRQQVAQLRFHPEVPVVTALRAGWTGKIWVSRRAPGGDPHADGPVDLLTPSGEYLGTVPAGAMTLPDAFGPDGLAAWIELDVFETPIVVVRRLPAELR